MALSKRDREFRLPQISYLDFKHIEMDRVLTAFFARLAHNGFPSRLRRKADLTVKAFVDEFLDHPEWFSGFQSYRDVLERWVETHLMDVVNRGKPNQAIAAPRPLHGFTYRFRNPNHSRDYGAAQHLYEMLHGARNGTGQKALEHLESFFFQGHDRVTGRSDTDATLDVETQALLRLLDQVDDAPDTQSVRDSHPPLCVGAADLLAEDLQRLLFYRNCVPRSVMVEYLKVLISFHLALYHLRLFKLLPALVRRQGADPTCEQGSCPMRPRQSTEPQGDCPYRVGLVVDVAGQPGTQMALLAEHSADLHYRRIPAFVRAYFATRKLHEFANDMTKRGRLPKPPGGQFSVGHVLQLLDVKNKGEREKFFGQRVYGMIEEAGSGTESELDPELKAVTDQQLPEFETYIEMLVAMRGRFHRQYITECVDSLLLKNRPGSLIAQGRTKGAPRRFILDSKLLEVLLQIAVLQPGGPRGYHTAEIRIEDLLTFLRERYGIHIDRMPKYDSLRDSTILDREALRDNVAAFHSRLRDIGYYRDLSDAHVTQTVTPRYRIDASVPPSEHGGLA